MRQKTQKKIPLILSRLHNPLCPVLKRLPPWGFAYFSLLRPSRNVKLKVLLAITCLAIAACSENAHAVVEYKILTGAESGTYHAIGRDLAKLVAPGADIKLQVVATGGSVANARLLVTEPGAKLAIIQAGVLQAIVNGAEAGSAEARELISAEAKSLRVVMPLFATELHYLVRADSEMNYLHDIENAKINVGDVGGGAGPATQAVYRMMFGQAIPEKNVTVDSNEAALIKLVIDKTTDVVMVASGQPAPLIANMKPGASKFVKLLKFDANHPLGKKVTGAYSPATINAASYPNLLTENFTTVAVGAYLVTFDFTVKDTASTLARFARQLCQSLPTLQALGHPKWHTVSLNLPTLGAGLSYYAPTEKELRACTTPQPQEAAEVPAVKAK
jgi:uncharacterized protein